MNELALLLRPIQPIDQMVLARHTRTVIAPEMQNCKAFREAKPRKSSAKPGSLHGKGKERVLTYLRSHSPSTTLRIINALNMHGDHTRRILRQLALEELAQCLDKGNRGERRPAIWAAVKKGDD